MKMKKSGYPLNNVKLLNDSHKLPGIEKILFPIFRWLDPKKKSCKPVGTAFLISENGLFITAKHVLTLRGKIKNPKLFGIYPANDHSVPKYPVKKVILSDDADIGLGILELKSNKKAKVFRLECKPHLCSTIPSEGEVVSTCVYRDNSYFFRPSHKLKPKVEYKWEFGTVRKYYPDGRDSYLLPGPCVETQMTLRSGVSGGPIINNDGFIIGVNSTSFSGHDRDISYFSPIAPILNLPFEVENKSRIIKTTLREMARRGWLSVKIDG